MSLKRDSFQIWICYLFLFVSYSLSSQKSDLYITYKKKYPDSPIIRLQDSVTYTIAINKQGELDITKDVFEQDLYLSRSATMGAKRSISYSSFVELASIEASSFSFNGTEYEENKVENFIERNDLDDTFYNDTKKVSFIYPKLGEGNITQIAFRYNIKNPRFLSAFYLADYNPIANNKITFIVDKNVDIEFRKMNMDGFEVNFEEKKKGKNIIYTWTKKYSAKFESDAGAPTFKSFVPHVIPMIKSYTVKNKTTKVLDGIESLYNWYYSLVSGINQQEEDQELKTLVNDLIKDKENDLEKVKAIYYWAQKNIKYIAFEYALGGFIPREANDVFKKKYGDCKDNSSILAEMLDIAELKGYLTWIGTREIPYTYEEVPTPAVDNHMILSYEYQGKTYYLDATGRFTAIEYPTSFIQGKEALVGKGEGNYEIKTVPVMAANKTVLKDKSYMKIVGDEIVGTSTAEISGYLKGNMFYKLEEFKKESDVIQFFNAYFEKGNNKFLIQKYTDQNKYCYDKNYLVTYDYTIKNYTQKYGDEVYVNPHFRKVATEFKLDDDRKRPIEYKFKRTFDFTNEIEIPEGFTVDYIPKNISLSNDHMKVELSYEQKENSVVCISKTTIDTILLDLEQQKEVNALIKKANKAYKEIIIFKKK